jgi:hypothetical protein
MSEEVVKILETVPEERRNCNEADYLLFRRR